jgi:hypothetical protein
MRHPEIKCANCQAFETVEVRYKLSYYCHAEPIKGHVVQAPARIDMSLSAQANQPPNFQIVPSFPPTSPDTWCMKIMLKPDVHKKMIDEALKLANESKSENERVERVEELVKLSKLNS